MKNLVSIQSLLHQMKENRKNIETQLECLDMWIETIEEELEEDMTEKQIKQKNIDFTLIKRRRRCWGWNQKKKTSCS